MPFPHLKSIPDVAGMQSYLSEFQAVEVKKGKEVKKVYANVRINQAKELPDSKTTDIDLLIKSGADLKRVDTRMFVSVDTQNQLSEVVGKIESGELKPEDFTINKEDSTKNVEDSEINKTEEKKEA